MATNDYTNIMLPGTKVRHKEYGFGSITEASEESVYVSFDGRIRIFPLPDAFLKGYISLAETNLKHDSYDGSASSNPKPAEKLLISDAFSPFALPADYGTRIVNSALPAVCFMV